MPDQDENKKTFSIGEVRERTGLTSRQIRYYEQTGLIESLRTHGQHRRFTEETIERLLLIKQLLKEKASIASVRQALDEGAESLLRHSEDRSLETDDYPRLARQELTSLYPVSNRANLLALLGRIESRTK